ncbi:MAG: rod shape-determining protein [Epulopiscium sp. Nele67-Bin005]|nr:MAG: rod shape-determining protein [Epulopiscium sp. Nele67-Bin005]
MFNRGADIGIDLGTASVLIYNRGQGIVVKEPSVVTIQENTGNVLAIGADAKDMIGRTPMGVRTIRPLRCGVISDYDATEQMLKYFINKAIGNRLIKPRIVVCVPSGVTEVEKKAVEDATRQAGARTVDIIEETIAAALGAGLDISKPYGNMIIDIGGGTTDIAVISLGGEVVKTSIKTAGDDFDEAIIKYVKRKYNLVIGEPTAEYIKMTIGIAFPDNNILELEVGGRSVVSGLPSKITLTSEEIRVALLEPLNAIVYAAHNVLELTPPELAADIYERGIMMTGGGSLLRGFDKLIFDNLKINAIIANDAISCVAIGTGLYIEYAHKQKKEKVGRI